MKMFRFNPSAKIIDWVNGYATEDEIKAENMFWQSDLAFTYQNCGPLTKRIITRINFGNYWYRPIIDTRVSMLIPGMYPSIPGFHCDWVKRGENGQPDLSTIDQKVRHVIAVISSSKNVSCTEFVTSPLDLYYSDEDIIWSEVNEQVVISKPTTRRIKPGDLLEFGQTDIHRATQCKNPGWRLFVRVSFVPVSPKNEIRNQTQTYLDSNFGW